MGGSCGLSASLCIGLRWFRPPRYNVRQTVSVSVTGKDGWGKVLPTSARQRTLPPGAVAKTAQREKQQQKSHRVPAAAAAAAAESPSDALQVQTNQSAAGSTNIGTRHYVKAPPRRKVAPLRPDSTGFLTASSGMKPTCVICLSTFHYPLHRRSNNRG